MSLKDIFEYVWNANLHLDYVFGFILIFISACFVMPALTYLLTLLWQIVDFINDKNRKWNNNWTERFHLVFSCFGLTLVSWGLVTTTYFYFDVYINP